jgi:hypothetical protein
MKWMSEEPEDVCGEVYGKVKLHFAFILMPLL